MTIALLSPPSIETKVLKLLPSFSDAVKGKKCSKCGEWKDLNNFYWRKDSNRHHTICCYCQRKRFQAYRATIKNSKFGILQAMLKAARQRAKKQNIPFNLSAEDLHDLAVDYCPITLEPLDWTRESIVNSRPESNSPSLDKNIPELGYVKNNCAIISYRGNTIKNNGTIDEHRRIVKYMAQQQLRDLVF
jgi:hypothetical protein